MTGEPDKHALVVKLNLVSKELVMEPNVQYRPREEVTAKLLEAFEILDHIGELEKAMDAVDIQEEESWDDPKIRKKKIQEFLEWLKSNGVNTDNLYIEFNKEQSRYNVFSRKPFPADDEIFRIPSSIIFSTEIQFGVDAAIPLEQFVKGPRRTILSEECLLGEIFAVMASKIRSDLRVYFDMLPRIKAHSHPMSFRKDEILKIQHFENLFRDSVPAIARIMLSYSFTYLQFHQLRPEFVKKDLLEYLTFRRYLWARLTVDVYSTTIFRTDDKGILRSVKTSLVPLLDMCEFQRDEEPLCDLKYVEGDLDDYVCLSLQRVRSMSQITRNYANPSYYACFSDYGFVPYIFGSGQETYRLALELTPSTDKHFDRRARIVLKTLGFRENELFEIQQHDLCDCHSKLSNVAMRLFLYANVIRGNTTLLDLIERDESDLTFLTKPTRMTWLYLAVKLRIKETFLKDKLFDLYHAIEKEGMQRIGRGIILSGRLQVIFFYVMNEFNSIHIMERAVKKQIEALGPDKPGIKDKFDCDETTLRKLYEKTLQRDICNSKVESYEEDFNGQTLHINLNVVSGS